MRKLSAAEATRLREAKIEVELWNRWYPIGTKVVLHKDSGDHFETTTRSEAEVSASGHAVCWFDGISGYYLLSRAEVVQ
jgi:hypothetical protein